MSFPVTETDDVTSQFEELPNIVCFYTMFRYRDLGHDSACSWHTFGKRHEGPYVRSLGKAQVHPFRWR